MSGCGLLRPGSQKLQSRTPLPWLLASEDILHSGVAFSWKAGMIDSPMTGEETARLCAKYADDKKAEDIVILDVRGISPITDYFVICTASSSPHLRAVQSEIDDMMIQEHGQRPRWRDTNFESEWLVLDYSDVMVHVFQAEKREFYSLEQLWGDAKRVEFVPEPPPSAAKRAKK